MKALDRGSQGLLFVVVGTAPLPFGSIEPFWTHLFLVLIAVSCLTAPWGRMPDSLHRSAGRIVLAILVVGVVTLLQFLPDPWWTVPDPIWRTVAPQIDRILRPRASSIASPPWETLGPSFLFALTALRALPIGADREAAKRLLHVVAWSGLFYAGFGILLLEIEPDRVLWVKKVAYVGNLTGPFVNRNTAATYFGSVAVIWLILALRAWFGSMRHRRRLWRAATLAGCLTCFAAVTLTGSRAGLLLTVAALLFTLFRLLPSYVTLRRYRKRAALVGMAACLALVEIWGGQVGLRIQAHGFADPGRLEMYRIALEMVRERPWLGHGAGSFEAAFPAYRSDVLGMFGVWDIAHSTPLEIAVEWGVPVLAVLCALWIWAALTIWRAGRIRGRDRSVVVAALAVGGLGTLHSMVDFSLQIPGYAVVFAALVGCGLGRSRLLTASRPDGDARRALTPDGFEAAATPVAGTR
ncbi:hypothetical protein ASF49_14150 [Methylobacterium sp. Leaf104]|uniref:O-antigen ligase family protein n=1 Tax=Methylobacterium goesingense TaxID=243690 RepID=UPI0006FB06B6|nr:O-antigen ligase family protein [Methylobacterium goesingense]KQP30638.1 hypothetical protein ASF49_14150 [Methylobacterium sp. Leaf104]